MGQDAVVRSVIWDGPAFQAGLAPGDKILTVDGRSFDAAALQDALAATRDAERAIILSVDGEDGPRSLRVRSRTV